ncbi:MAG: hypothetical protein DRI23_11785 [Candidatus Cloacimonadota bacterium]|nr:MAG: hypothetical protein DRI23_11785 [Candidatus Cloacimonadota bacterium]RLC53435.1 MAG: hypothetical protein DRH79_03610 [Candidatus Cloacimonadota bacterium]
MRYKFLLLFVFINVSSLLIGTTYHIKQDGTGDFTTIQEGIEVAVDADTILVFPGTYYENADFLSKSLILGSLYLTTGNEEYITQTTIDGNQTGSCVEIRDCVEDFTSVIGFTLTNGTGSQLSSNSNAINGGGVFIKNSTLTISNCIIYRNIAWNGGGIYCNDSSLFLSGTTIRDNRSHATGGGITISSSSEVIFDDQDLCNIYLNFSRKGCDIRKTYTSAPINVFIDTFTVFNPDNYFVGCWNQYGVPVNDITMNIQNAKLSTIDANLYVSTVGDNNNSGLTPDDPLATINYAFSLIQTDSLENNTIFLTDGVYSTSLNDQWFPIQMRSYTNLVGESMENTILDAENNSPLIADESSKLNYNVINLNLINGNCLNSLGGGIPYILCFADSQFRNKWVYLENILIHDCLLDSRTLALWYLNASLINVHVYDNIGIAGSIESRIAPVQTEPIFSLELENCSIKNCNTTGLALFDGFFQEERSPVILKNVEITDNIYTETSWPNAICGIIVHCKRQIEMINCTIGNNYVSTANGGTIGMKAYGSELNIYNSILYGNDQMNIWLENDNEENPNVVNIQNSLIANGEESCYIVNSWDTINWLEGNLPADSDPLWVNTGNYPYQLSTDSPCIDTGTLYLPTGIELPEYDLAGNPRICGETIDIGAYEYQDSISAVEEEFLLSPIPKARISNFPNPFNPSTTIKLELAEAGKIELAIYNIKGEKVKTLLNCTTAPGTYECFWNGKDEVEKFVSSGLYVVKLNQYGKETATKILLLK